MELRPLHLRRLAPYLLAAAALAACGKTADSGVSDAGSGVDATAADANEPADAAGSDVVAFDGGAPDVTDDGAPPTHPDGGPAAPVLPCTDAGLCPFPPSVCLDENWLRYYQNGTCDADSGTCSYAAVDMLCPAGSVPRCANGGCTVVIVR